MTETRQESNRIRGADDLSEVHRRFGKGDFLASLVGMLAGLGTLVFLSALIAAGRASIAYQLNLVTSEGTLDEASIAGLAVAIAVVFVSFLVGGFAAGRMSRYSGGLNGFGAGLWMLLLVTVFAALGVFVGSEYNAFNRVDLPNWVAQIDVDQVTGVAILASVLLAAATLLGGYIGGRIGELYHHRADAAIAQTIRKEV
jgi:hypothetical protein